ncbi:MAG: glyoxalase [Lachnospiraceae bacterium]|nr:glyoxalase [Lachnospiraceae bacterium]
MPEFDDLVLDAFLEQQTKLYPKKVADTREEARDFLEESFAVVLGSAKEVWDYFEEEGIDPGDLGKGDITEADEVFAVGDGRFLIVEG